MNGLDNKIAVITGGKQGLGAAIARQFAECGAAGIVTCGRNTDNCNSVAGAIVNIGSASVKAGQPFIAPYCASKGALATLTKNSGYALIRNRIRVNQLNLGWMASDGEDRIQREYHDADPNWLEKAVVAQPFGRLIDPKEVARAVAFLASKGSGMMTGAFIHYDQSVWGAYSFAPPSPDEPLAE